MKITWNTDVNAHCCHGEILAENGRSILIQTDCDYPGTARSFGWNLADVQPDKRTASFDRFSLELPAQAIDECSHQGSCDEDVEHWAEQIVRPEAATPEALKAELKECVAWEADELADDAANWQRLIWIAACNLREEGPCEHDGTDGTVDCPNCGMPTWRFIAAAREWLDDHDGAEVDDPGYFSDGE